MSKKIPTTPDAANYNHSFNGTALNVLIVRGSIPATGVAAANILARVSGFSYNVDTPVTKPDEINVRYVKETNYSRQELGTGRFDCVFTMRQNDQMPTWDTLGTEPELTFFEVTGADHDMTAGEVPTILNVFEGGRIVNHASATVVSQQKVLNVSVIFRKKTPGIDYSGGSAFTSVAGT